MQISEQVYPDNVTVAVTNKDGFIRVRVYQHGKRGAVLGDPVEPIPKLTYEEKRKRKVLAARDAILALIRRFPRRSYSYYTRLPVSEGGYKGSQDVKELVLNDLIRCGAVRMVPLEKPVGRMKAYVELDEGVVSTLFGADTQGLPSAG